jgi:hypothetical protein
VGADIADPYLQGYADYDRECKEEGVFQEQLSPQGRIFDKIAEEKDKIKGGG